MYIEAKSGFVPENRGGKREGKKAASSSITIY